MTRKLLILFFITAIFTTGGCVKDTFDMNKLSKKAHLSPTLAVSAVKGNISLNDIVKTNDTLFFDENKLLKVVFKKDSVIDLKLADFYDLNDMVTFSQTNSVGLVSLGSFQGTVSHTLNQIVARFDAGTQAKFVGLNDGHPHIFPAFPLTDLGEKSFPLFTNYTNAVLSSGAIDIYVTNNLTAPLNGANITLFNYSGHIPIGNEATVSDIQPGETRMTSIDLTDKTITNSIIAAIVLSGSPGTSPTQVIIDFDQSNVQVEIHARDLKIKSGSVILPMQTIFLENSKDTVTFVPGANIELNELKVTTGNISYHIQSTSPVSGSFALKLPTVKRGGIPLTETININPNSTQNGTISVNNTIADLGTITLRPFNRMPIEYTLTLSSNAQMINFNENDQIRLDLNLINPDFDFVKGYFGQETHTGDQDTLDLEIKDILDHISGDFLLSSPSIKLNYSNSFAIPMQIKLEATGNRNTESVDLGLAPFNITYPNAPVNRDITSTFTIDKTNSSLPALISLLPDKIRFSSVAKMNPQGNTGARNNYIFGNSRFIGSLEVEVPVEFRANNLQFTDTVDNFLKIKGSDQDNPIKPENFEFLRVDLTATNGFPFGVSLKMSLYDSSTHTMKSTINADKILEPAQVDNNGKVTTPTESSASIEFTKDFFNSIDGADEIIFQFTLVTTGNGSKDVKIYSDYVIDFKAALVLKPDINIDLK